MDLASYYVGLSYKKLSLLSNNQRKSTGRRAILSAEGRRLLSLLNGRPLDNGDIARDGNGRPFIPGLQADFNISHSENMVAVSFVRAAKNHGEELRTGCDIELVRPRANIERITKEFFSTSENEYILQGGNRHSLARFYEIWTLKECFLKLRGLSVFEMQNVPSFVCDEGHFAFSAAVSSPLTFYVYELSGNEGERYSLASAIEGNAGNPEPLPEIRWFSQPETLFPTPSSPELPSPSRELPPPFLSARSIAVIKAPPSPAETVRPKM